MCRARCRACRAGYDLLIDIVARVPINVSLFAGKWPLSYVICQSQRRFLAAGVLPTTNRWRVLYQYEYTVGWALAGTSRPLPEDAARKLRPGDRVLIKVDLGRPRTQPISQNDSRWPGEVLSLLENRLG
jgi:hypothetical protein